MTDLSCREYPISCIELSGIGKRYGANWVLKDISATFTSGQLTLLMGKNGAGKSTLLWLLSTLLKEDEGVLLYDGDPKHQVSSQDLRRQIGMLTHDAMCYPQFTALENLVLFAKLYGYPQAEATTLSQKWLKSVQLDHVKNKRAHTFSEGMQKKLSIAKAFFHQPSVLLLDEPYTGLDVQGKEMLSKHIMIAKQRGAIVIIATHELAEVAPFCDRLIILSKGKVFHRASFESDCQPSALFRLLEGAP